MGVSVWEWDISPSWLTVLPIWAFGLVLGLVLPRPKVSDFLKSDVRSLLSFLPGTGLALLVRRLALLLNATLFVRQLWYSVASKGTFRSLVWTALVWVGLVTATSTVLQQEVEEKPVKAIKGGALETRVAQPAPEGDESSDWYVTEEDLEFFRDRIERDVVVEGASKWDKMCDKEFDNFTYTAWRRCLADGKTEYKSVTVADDSTAEEFTDFYLDDPTRPKWDSMISEYELVENGDAKDRCQVVRWMRTFPFSFINKREYVIARRMFRRDGCLYGITKSIKHSAVPENGQVVRMDVFYSMWRSRTVPCPKGSDKPACETVLLHHEQFKIPENLARFAVRHGMTGFVKKMGPAVKVFIEERRQRVKPFDNDFNAYGLELPSLPRPLPLSTSPSTASIMSSSSSSSEASWESDETDPQSVLPPAAPQVRRRRHRRDKNRLRSVGAMVLATGVGMAIARSNSRRSLRD